MTKRKSSDGFSSPLEDDPLVETLYRAPTKKDEATPAKRDKRRRPLAKGKTYRLVTFSFYEEDVARLDALLAEAKASGRRRASRSQIVRLALRDVDVNELPEEI